MNENQKRGLIFLKEVGAIDNSSYRQLNGIDILKASTDLRDLRRKDIVNQKGKGKATYYVGGSNLVVSTNDVLNTPPDALNTPPDALNTPPDGLNSPPPGLSTPPPTLSTPPGGLIKTVRQKISNDLADRIDTLGKRVNDKTVLTNLIKEICSYGSFKSSEIAELLGKREDYIKRNFLSPMIGAGELKYLYPEMIHHPEQAYQTPE